MFGLPNRRVLLRVTAFRLTRGPWLERIFFEYSALVLAVIQRSTEKNASPRLRASRRDTAIRNMRLENALGEKQGFETCSYAVYQFRVDARALFRT